MLLPWTDNISCDLKSAPSQTRVFGRKLPPIMISCTIHIEWFTSCIRIRLSVNCHMVIVVNVYGNFLTKKSKIGILNFSGLQLLLNYV